MRKKSLKRPELRLVQRPLKPYSARKRIANHPQIIQLNLGALGSDQLNSFVEASARQPHMTPMKFGAGDNPRLAEGRETHGLRTIELWILEGCQAYEPRRRCRRQIGPIYIELVGDHYRDLAR
jgi:hypothetical protein